MIQIILCRQRNKFFIYDFEYLYLEQADGSNLPVFNHKKKNNPNVSPTR